MLHLRQNICAKIVTIVVLCLFSIETVAWSAPVDSKPQRATLAPPIRLDQEKFHEDFAAMRFLLHPEAPNTYIREQIGREIGILGKETWESQRILYDLENINDPNVRTQVRGNIKYDVPGVDQIKFVKVAGVLAKTGQFGHVGLRGKDYGGVTVAYVDSVFFHMFNNALIRHETDEILQWEYLRVNILKLETKGEMRQWIANNLTKIDPTALTAICADRTFNVSGEMSDCVSVQDVARKIHEKSYSLAELYDFVDKNRTFDVTQDPQYTDLAPHVPHTFDYDYIADLLDRYRDVEPTHVNIAAGKDGNTPPKEIAQDVYALDVTLPADTDVRVEMPAQMKGFVFPKMVRIITTRSVYDNGRIRFCINSILAHHYDAGLNMAKIMRDQMPIKMASDAMEGAIFSTADDFVSVSVDGTGSDAFTELWKKFTKEATKQISAGPLWAEAGNTLNELLKSPGCTESWFLDKDIGIIHTVRAGHPVDPTREKVRRLLLSAVYTEEDYYIPIPESPEGGYDTSEYMGREFKYWKTIAGVRIYRKVDRPKLADILSACALLPSESTLDELENVLNESLRVKLYEERHALGIPVDNLAVLDEDGYENHCSFTGDGDRNNIWITASMDALLESSVVRAMLNTVSVAPIQPPIKTTAVATHVTTLIETINDALATHPITLYQASSYDEDHYTLTLKLVAPGNTRHGTVVWQNGSVRRPDDCKRIFPHAGVLYIARNADQREVYNHLFQTLLSIYTSYNPDLATGGDILAFAKNPEKAPNFRLPAGGSSVFENEYQVRNIMEIVFAVNGVTPEIRAFLRGLITDRNLSIRLETIRLLEIIGLIDDKETLSQIQKIAELDYADYHKTASPNSDEKRCVNYSMNLYEVVTAYASDVLAVMRAAKKNELPPYQWRWRACGDRPEIGECGMHLIDASGRLIAFRGDIKYYGPEVKIFNQTVYKSFNELPDKTTVPEIHDASSSDYMRFVLRERLAKAERLNTKATLELPSYLDAIRLTIKRIEQGKVNANDEDLGEPFTAKNAHWTFRTLSEETDYGKSIQHELMRLYIKMLRHPNSHMRDVFGVNLVRQEGINRAGAKNALISCLIDDRESPHYRLLAAWWMARSMLTTEDMHACLDTYSRPLSDESHKLITITCLLNWWRMETSSRTPRGEVLKTVYGDHYSDLLITAITHLAAVGLSTNDEAKTAFIEPSRLKNLRSSEIADRLNSLYGSLFSRLTEGVESSENFLAFIGKSIFGTPFTLKPTNIDYYGQLGSVEQAHIDKVFNAAFVRRWKIIIKRHDQAPNIKNALAGARLGKITAGMLQSIVGKNCGPVEWYFGEDAAGQIISQACADLSNTANGSFSKKRNNRSCGTICEAGHQELLDPQFEAFYQALTKEGDASAVRDLKANPLSENQVIELLENTGRIDHDTAGRLQSIIAHIKEKIPDLAKENVQLLFAIPPDNSKLWWIDNPDYNEGSKLERRLYAGGHFRVPKPGDPDQQIRIHISLPLILGEADPDEAARAIAKHDYSHIKGEPPVHDETEPGMRIVMKAATTISANNLAPLAAFIPPETPAEIKEMIAAMLTSTDITLKVSAIRILLHMNTRGTLLALHGEFLRQYLSSILYLDEPVERALTDTIAMMLPKSPGDADDDADIHGMISNLMAITADHHELLTWFPFDNTIRAFRDLDIASPGIRFVLYEKGVHRPNAHAHIAATLYALGLINDQLIADMLREIQTAFSSAQQIHIPEEAKDENGIVMVNRLPTGIIEAGPTIQRGRSALYVLGELALLENDHPHIRHNQTITLLLKDIISRGTSLRPDAIEALGKIAMPDDADAIRLIGYYLRNNSAAMMSDLRLTCYTALSRLNALTESDIETIRGFLKDENGFYRLAALKILMERKRISEEEAVTLLDCVLSQEIAPMRADVAAQLVRNGWGLERVQSWIDTLREGNRYKQNHALELIGSVGEVLSERLATGGADAQKTMRDFATINLPFVTASLRSKNDNNRWWAGMAIVPLATISALPEPVTPLPTSKSDDIARAIELIDTFIAPKLAEGNVFEIRYDKKRLDANADLSTSGISPAEEFLIEYVKHLRMRVREGKSEDAERAIKLVESSGHDEDGPYLFSVKRMKGINDQTVLGESHIDITDNIKGQALRMPGMLNIVFAGSLIPLNSTDADIDNRITEYIKKQYFSIAGVALPTPTGLVRALTHILLPHADIIDIKHLPEYYRNTTIRLQEAA